MLAILLKIKDLLNAAINKLAAISPIALGIVIGYFGHGPIKFISTVLIGSIKLLLKL